MYKLLISLAILLVLHYPAQSQSHTPGLVGYKSFYIKDSLAKTLDKIKRQKLDQSSKQLKMQKHSINPYMILTKRFLPFFYTSDSLKVKHKNNLYYLTFEGLQIDHPEYTVYSNGSRFFLQYRELKTLNIQKLKDLQNLDPHIDHFSFQFYQSVLYQMIYRKKVNMDELNEIISGFTSRYKRMRGSIRSNKGLQYKVITWKRGEINIQLTLNLRAYNNLNKVDTIRGDSGDFKNQPIYVSITDHKILRDINNYKSGVHENLMDTLKQMSEDQQRKLKSITQPKDN